MTGISKFEEYLLRKGFIPYFYNRSKEWEIYKRDNISYSTMDILCLSYRKGKRKVIYGLNEAKHPPCLIHPRPKIIVLRNNSRITELNDSAVDVLFQNETVEDIFKSLWNKQINFKYDLRNENI